MGKIEACIERRSFLDLPLDVELRADSATSIVSGIAIKYGVDSQVIPGLRELFEPGAFSPIGDVSLNLQHQRDRALARNGGSGLELRDSAIELRATAELDTETSDGKDATRLLKRRILRGFSVEFRAIRSRFESGSKDHIGGQASRLGAGGSTGAPG